VGDLVLDPGARTCRRGSSTIELTAREFSVLEFLMRAQGDVVTKSDIVQNVWDTNFDGDLNVVEVHVSALRRKIDTPFGSRTIHTVRGAGYRVGST
jgi:DNA-binding response OmpR family regulator